MDILQRIEKLEQKLCNLLQADQEAIKDLHFANANLTATSNRTHLWAGFDLNIEGLREYNINASDNNGLGGITLRHIGGMGDVRDNALRITATDVKLGYYRPSTGQQGTLTFKNDSSLSLSSSEGLYDLLNLKGDPTQDRLIGQQSISGRLNYITIGSGLSLVEGVLSSVIGGGGDDGGIFDGHVHSLFVDGDNAAVSGAVVFKPNEGAVTFGLPEDLALYSNTPQRLTLDYNVNNIVHKYAVFDLSAISNNSQRIYAFPDHSGTLATLEDLNVNTALSSLTNSTKGNVINSADFAQDWRWNTLADGTGLKLSTTSTAASGNTHKLLELDLTGLNAAANQSTYGLYVSNTHGGTGAVNYGIYAQVPTGGHVAVYGSGAGSAQGVKGVSSSGIGVYGSSTSGIGVNGQSTSGPAGSFTSGTGNAIAGATTGGSRVLSLLHQDTSTNTTKEVARFLKSSTGTPAIGLGGYLVFSTNDDASIEMDLAGIEWKLTNAVHANPSGQLSLKTKPTSGAMRDVFILKATGQGQLNFYGIGAFTGTPAYNLQVDASGNIIEGSLAGITTVAMNNIIAATGVNTINNADFKQEWQWNSLGTANTEALKLSSNSTAINAAGSKLLSVDRSGSNSAASASTYGISSLVTTTAATGFNFGVSGIASGAQTNTGVYGSGSTYGVQGVSTGSGVYGKSTGNSGGVVGEATSGASGIGGWFFNSAASGLPTGLLAQSNGAGITNVAARLEATNATNNYALIVPAGMGRVGFGTSSPSPSSLLDLTSTTQGFLTPRMTAAQRDTIPSPATGLLVHVTDAAPGFYYYNGSAWVAIAASSTGTGTITSINTLTDPIQNFAFGAAGITPNVVSASGLHTFNHPLAGTGVLSGTISNANQTIDGIKTFSNGLQVTTSATNFYPVSTANSLAITSANYLFAGATGVNIRNGFNNGANNTVITAAYNYAGSIILGGLATEAASGAHNIVTALAIRPVALTNGAATTTNAATLYIEGITTGTATPTNNYALWVDAGHSKFDDTLSIGAGNLTPSAILDVNSTTLASIPAPKMTTAQRDAIASPSEGFQVFNLTTHTLNYYNGTAWAGFGTSLVLNGLVAATSANTIDNTNFTQEWQWSTLQATALKLSTTSTLAAASSQRMLEVSMSGINATSNQSTYGVYVNNAHSGTGAINYGVYSTVPVGGGVAILGSTTDTSTGVRGQNSTIGIGVFGSSSSGIGVQGTSVSGTAFNGDGGTGLIMQGVITPVSTATVVPLISLTRSTSGTAGDGIGGSIDFNIKGNVSTALSNQLISKWSTALDANRTSQFEITGVNNTTVQTLSTFKGTGQLQLNRYGLGTFTGTGVYNLQVDASGNLIEGAIPVGGGGSGSTEMFVNVGDADYTIPTGPTVNYTVVWWVPMTVDRNCVLPTAVGNGGKVLWITNGGLGFKNVNLSVVVKPNVTASFNVIGPSGWVRVYSDGTNWVISAKN